MKKKILWLKWVDPTASACHEDEEDDDYELESKHDELYRDGDIKWKKSGTTAIGPAYVGPLGVIPVNESVFPSKLFNFWMGHTNVDLREDKRVQKIANVPGVETLDVYSRYRFRLGIGKAFKQEAVKADVERAICSDPPVTTSPAYADNKHAFLKSILAKQYRFWAICTPPNGVCKYFGGQTKEEVLGQLAGITGEVVYSWS